jgi:hypothetical protein
MIFNPKVHVSKIPHPKSSEHKRYFVYKQGKCYLEGACLSQLYTFVSQRRDSLNIPKEVVVLETNLFTTLKDVGYVIESMTASYDALVQEYLNEKARCEQQYKDDLFKWLGILSMSKSTFEKFYNLSAMLNNKAEFEFGYEEFNYVDKHEGFEQDLKEVVEIGMSLVRDLKQR